MVSEHRREQHRTTALRVGTHGSFRDEPPGRRAPLAGWSRTLALAVALLALLVTSPPSTAAPSPHRQPPASTQVILTWPLDPVPAVARRFEAPPHPYGRGHRGVDLHAEPGRTVRAAAAGTVVHAGPVAGRGVVSIEHPTGLRTTYEPLTPIVRKGEQVTAGAPIGTVEPGHGGCPTSTCLHWGALRGEQYVDPLGLLGTLRIRLKPTARRGGAQR